LNTKTKEYFIISIGVLGAIIILLGISINSDIDYVLGSTLLLITAFYYKCTFFIALEMIIIAGHGAALLGLGHSSQIILPILLCIQLLFYYLLSGKLNDIYLIVGIIGIVFLTMSLSFGNVLYILLGSIGTAIYSISQVFKGKSIALIWAVLNVIAIFVTIYKIIY